MKKKLWNVTAMQTDWTNIYLQKQGKKRDCEQNQKQEDFLGDHPVSPVISREEYENIYMQRIKNSLSHIKQYYFLLRSHFETTGKKYIINSIVLKGHAKTKVVVITILFETIHWSGLLLLGNDHRNGMCNLPEGWSHTLFSAEKICTPPQGEHLQL